MLVGMKALALGVGHLLAASLLVFPAALSGQIQVANLSPSGLPIGWQGRMAFLAPGPNQVVQPMEQRPGSLIELQRRVKDAGGSPSALGEVLRTAAKGEIPDYNEALGISRSEFKKYLIFEPSLVASGKPTRLNLTLKNNRLIFGSNSALGGILDRLVLDLGTGELTTPEGFSTFPRVVPPNSAIDGALNSRGGFIWTFRGTRENGYGIRGEFKLLQLSSSKMILTYSRLSMKNWVNSEGDIIISYYK